MTKELTETNKDQKQKMLTHDTATATQSIADAIAIKDDTIFLVCSRNGNISMKGKHGLGIYYHDCRYLSGYELRLGDSEAESLAANSRKGFQGIFESTNLDLHNSKGENIARQTISIRWKRTINSEELALYDTIRFKNFGLKRASFDFEIFFRCEFEDVFAVRGMLKAKRGKLNDPELHEDSMLFSYEGVDGIYRNLRIRCTDASFKDNTLHSKLDLEAGESKTINIVICLSESKEKEKIPRRASIGEQKIESQLNRDYDRWEQQHTDIKTDSLLANSLIGKSLTDLRILRTKLNDDNFFAAGIPWFATLFGRDSLITAIQMLAFNPDIARETLELLAKYQGTKADEWKDEQPGKILHELRIGEMANSGQIPHSPYYGTVDATPLFLILVGLYSQWTGNLKLFHSLRKNIDQALWWIKQHGDANGDGYVEYESESDEGLVNQGWKDSGNAIVNSDGTIAVPPISLVEVQAYVYYAKILIAQLFERDENQDVADQLRKEAAKLRTRFHQDYWMQQEGIFALALQADNQQVSVVSSNAGHALWAEIANETNAEQTADRLMKRDMFNGWGVRTLSSNEKRYNPAGYHLGSVWPHDNAIIASGFRKYGHEKQAMEICNGIFRAAMLFEDYRLSELFSGFSREDFGVPVHYPVACRPQAWASGSLLYMMSDLLGLTPNGFEKKLLIVRPSLPDFIESVEVKRLRVADAVVDLKYVRNSENRPSVDVMNVEGKLDIVIQP